MSSFDFGAEFASFGEELKGVAYSGDYTMRVDKVVPGQTAKGKQQFLVTLAFTSGPLAAKGKTVVDRHVWSPESEVAARIFAQNLAKMGATQEWIMSNHPSPEEIADQMTGAVVECRLKQGEFNGQPQTNVSYLKTVSSKAAGAVAKTGSAAAAVSLDDDDAPVAAPAAAPAPAATAATDGEPTTNPWAA